MMAEHSTAPGYTDDTCRGDSFSRGVNTSHPAAQPFYDSLAELWTEWGTDSVKVDCNRLNWMGARQEIFALAHALARQSPLPSLDSSQFPSICSSSPLVFGCSDVAC